MDYTEKSRACLRAPTPPCISTNSLLCAKVSHYTVARQGIKQGNLTLTGGWQETV